MPAFLDLIRQAQALNLPKGSPVAKVFEDALEAVLLAEGPPPQPVDELSEGLATSIVRSSTGRVRYLAHTWITGPWNCLLLDLAPVPMGRPQMLIDKATKKSRVTVDYPSRKMQDQIRFACHTLKLAPPPEPCRVASFFDRTRTFIAWTAYTEEVSILKGDIDNYGKNVLDGLQRGSLIRNDKSVAALLALNYPMPEARRTLEEYMRDQIHAHLEKHPSHSPKTVAKALDYPVQRTERAFKTLSSTIAELRSDLIRQHLAKHPEASRPSQIAKATRLTQKAVSSLLPSIEMPKNEPLPASMGPSPAPAAPLRRLERASAGKGAGSPDSSHSHLIVPISQDLVAPPPHQDNLPPRNILPIQKGLDNSNKDLLDVPQAPSP